MCTHPSYVAAAQRTPIEGFRLRQPERYSDAHTLLTSNLFGGYSSHVLRGVPGRLSSLQHLDMDPPGIHGDLVKFLESLLLRLSELTLCELSPRLHQSSVRPWLLSADSWVTPNSLHRTLTRLRVGGDDELDMAVQLDVLARCVNLQDLCARGVTTDGRFGIRDMPTLVV